jgi:hypothetical protein
MQRFELVALVVLVLVPALAVLVGRHGASAGPARKLMLAVVIGLVAAFVVLSQEVDVLPDQVQGVAEVALIVTVSVFLVAIRGRDIVRLANRRR